MLGQPQWGIFDQSGNAVLVADSVFSVEYAHDYKVSDYPQEQGSFQSYNKVQIPWQVKITYLIASTRQAFLTAVEAAVASLSLYVVVTPEVSYPSANLTHVSYRRVARNGVSMIAVDVWLEEIRITSSTTASNSQSTNGAAPQNGGVVQTANWQSSVTAIPPT